MEKTYNTCLDLISQEKKYFTESFSFKRRPLNDIHQMLSWFLGEYTPAQNKTDFESAGDFLLEAH